MLDAFDFALITNILAEYGRGTGFIGRMIFTYGIIYLIMNTFFSGGILHLLNENSEFSLRSFITGCIQYFKRFFKLLFLSLLTVIFVIITYFMITAVLGIFTKNATTEFWPFTLFFAKILLVIGMLAMLNMLFDYAKIIIVYNDFHRIFKSVKDTIMFIMMSLLKTTALYGLLFMTAIIILLMYLAVESTLNVTNAVTVLVFFIVTQIYMMAKMFIRLSFYTGQFTFYKYSNTAMPGMTRDMLDEAITNYEKRAAGDVKPEHE